MVLEFKDYKPEIFKDGKWIIPKSNNLYRKFNFSAPYNAQTVVPMTMEELRIIPKLFPTVQETGFFVAGFNKFTDWFIMPIMMYILLPLFGNFSVKPLAKLFMMSLRKFSKPPFGLKLVADIYYKEAGKEKNIKYELSHEDGYKLTAIPVVACLMQYFENRKTGLFFQSEYPEANRFFEDMSAMGIEISVGS
jgi:saccharopine dehydrogenase (NAD+, L-lysine-forming)